MKIIIEKIPQGQQRYSTCDDYWMNCDNFERFMEVKISARSNIEFYLYTIHALVEAFLAKHRGISWDDITDFDVTSGLKDPGRSKKACYHKEHVFASKVEQMLLKELRKKK